MALHLLLFVVLRFLLVSRTQPRLCPYLGEKQLACRLCDGEQALHQISSLLVMYQTIPLTPVNAGVNEMRTKQQTGTTVLQTTRTGCCTD